MEDSSENRRGRGRPRKISSEITRGFVSMGLIGNELTWRQQQEQFFALQASGLLQKDRRWMKEFEYLVREKPLRYRVTILAELGRLAEMVSVKERIRELARSICKKQLPTKQAVILLKRLRLGNEGQKATVLIDLGLEDSGWVL